MFDCLPIITKQHRIFFKLFITYNIFFLPKHIKISSVKKENYKQEIKIFDKLHKIWAGMEQNN